MMATNKRNLAMSLHRYDMKHYKQQLYFSGYFYLDNQASPKAEVASDFRAMVSLRPKRIRKSLAFIFVARPVPAEHGAHAAPPLRAHLGPPDPEHPLLEGGPALRTGDSLFKLDDCFLRVSHRNNAF
jgi:hypothetical protein